MGDYKRKVEIVHETEKVYIAFLDTGYNCYINSFDKKFIDDLVSEVNTQSSSKWEHYTAEKVLSWSSITGAADMLHMCRYEDLNDELLASYIKMLLER